MAALSRANPGVSSAFLSHDVVLYGYPALQAVHYYGQILAMNDCGYRQMYDSKYLLVQDLDEFVVPTVAKDWSSMLDNISEGNSTIQRDRIASYGFRNRFFGHGLRKVSDQVVCF